MGLGGYRFGDYLKAGLPLDLITLAAVLLVVPLIWPWH
jgi:di/tricarboxylate transporter